jgi:transcriptional regulator with XRE-family HTH domain
MASREEVLKEVGRALRMARRARGLTLRDVGTRSQGQFKPTAVAGYERAERAVSLERFCALAQLYGMGPERLLSQIMWRIRGGPEPTIDRGRLREVPAHEADTVSAFIEGVRRLRGNADGETITIRIQDLEVLATVSGRQLQEFLGRLRPALTAHASRD